MLDWSCKIESASLSLCLFPSHALWTVDTFVKLSFIISTNDKMVFSKSFVYSHNLSVFKENKKKKTNLIEKMTKNNNDVNIYLYEAKIAST